MQFCLVVNKNRVVLLHNTKLRSLSSLLILSFTFHFTDKNDPAFLITFHNESDTVWETETVCTRVIKVHSTKVGLQCTLGFHLTSSSPTKINRLQSMPLPMLPSFPSCSARILPLLPAVSLRQHSSASSRPIFFKKTKHCRSKI